MVEETFAALIPDRPAADQHLAVPSFTAIKGSERLTNSAKRLSSFARSPAAEFLLGRYASLSQQGPRPLIVIAATVVDAPLHVAT